MTLFKNLSIKSKMTLIIMLTSCIALLLACIAFVAYELVTFRGNLAEDVSTLAEITGKNCAAAVSFNRPDDAEKTLANLSGESQIMAACIFREGKVWARFPQALTRSELPERAANSGHRFENNSLGLF